MPRRVGGRVGEKLTPVPFPEPVYVLVRPNVAVSTSEVFKDPELTRDSPVITIRDSLTAGVRNDCEPVVRRRFPAVAEALDWLDQFAPARLTGTGSCVYAAMPDEASARQCSGNYPGAGRVRGARHQPLAADCPLPPRAGPDGFRR